MSGDLISRKALLGEFEWLLSVVYQYRKYDVQDSIQRIKNAPAVDAVCVVRCEKCKWFEPCEEIEGVTWTGFCKYGEFHTDEYDFCSRGERRSE